MQQEDFRPLDNLARRTRQPQGLARSALPVALCVLGLGAATAAQDFEYGPFSLTGFAKVNGDFNFRPTPVDRLKFWYRHKLHGFDDAYADKTCVGCGRCTVSCPSGIDDIVAVVKALQVSSASKNGES